MRRGHSAVWQAVTVSIVRPLLFALTRREWRGQHNIPRTGGMILAANHLSWTDPLALAHFVYLRGRWPLYLAKSQLFEIRGLGYALRRLGQIPVYRNTTDAAHALRAAEQGLRDGGCLMFYPEGTCTRDPRLWPMAGRSGAARLALSTGKPVIPVAHWGPHELLPYGEKKPRLFPRKTMHVIAGPPVDLSKYEGCELTNQVLRDATADIMAEITRLLGELRGEEPPQTQHQEIRGTGGESSENRGMTPASGGTGTDTAAEDTPEGRSST